jgi:cation transport regulator ChaB
MADKLSIFIPISKYDAKQRLVYGTLAAEVPDKTKEILDYDTGKLAFQKWSDEIKKASGGRSLGNLRVMHQPVVGGVLKELSFDDANKTITGVGKVLNDETHRLIEEGALTGFSIGGGYSKRWQDPTDSSLKRYSPSIAEVSLVDNCCIPGCTFEYVKADGTTELRKLNDKADEELHKKVTEIAAELLKKAKLAKKGKDEELYGDADSTQKEGADAGMQDDPGVQGYEAKEGEQDTVLPDKTKAKPGIKDIKDKDYELDETMPAKVSDKAKEKDSAVMEPKAATAGEIANKAVELAKAVGKEDQWTSFIEAANAELDKSAKPAPKKDAIQQPDKKDAADDEPTGLDKGAVQGWAHSALPGQVFAKRSDLRKALAAKQAADGVAKISRPVQDALAALHGALETKPLDEEAFDPGKLGKRVGEWAVTEAKDVIMCKVWASNGELPDSVKGLPDEAKTVFRSAANARIKKGGDDESAMKIGWTAVKNGWMKKGDDWVKKEGGEKALAKREYSDDERKKYAKEGIAMDDGSYPIPDKDALEDAVQAYGRASNKAATKRHIMKRAKALDAESSLPEDWGKTEKLAKAEDKEAFFSLPEAALMLAFLEKGAAMAEGALVDQYNSMADVYAVMVDKMVEELGKDAEGALEKATKLGDLLKIGAKHSKADKGKIKQAHDVLSDLDPDCCPANDDDDDDEDGSEKMVKLHGALEKVTAERDALTKALTDLVPQITEQTKLVKELRDSVKRIEDSPAPGPTLSVGKNGEPVYTVVNKGDDMRGGDIQSIDPLDKIASDPSTMAGLAELGIRLAHRHPQHTVPGVQYPSKPPGR